MAVSFDCASNVGTAIIVLNDVCGIEVLSHLKGCCGVVSKKLGPKLWEMTLHYME
jgi:hypothetical protein